MDNTAGVRLDTAVDARTRVFPGPFASTGSSDPLSLAQARRCSPSPMRAADGSRVALLDRMRLSTRWIAIGVAVCASLVPLDVAAQVHRLPADKTLSPFFFVDGGDPAIDRLPLKDTRVDVAIAGVIADVTVRQVYENRGQRSTA